MREKLLYGLLKLLDGLIFEIIQDPLIHTLLDFTVSQDMANLLRSFSRQVIQKSRQIAWLCGGNQYDLIQESEVFLRDF